MTFRTGLTEEEEEKHVKIGAWLGLLILPLLLLCFCGIFAVTPRGRVALADLVIRVALDGIPYAADAEIPYTGGIVGVSKISCTLERLNPRPTDYQASQDQLETQYQTLLGLYNDSWKELKDGGEDITEFRSPTDVPSDLAGGRRTFCR